MLSHFHTSDLILTTTPGGGNSSPLPGLKKGKGFVFAERRVPGVKLGSQEYNLGLA